MAISWTDTIKKTGKLTVYNGIQSGLWATVFDASLDSFNALNKRYGLGVKLVKTKDKDSANVVVQSTDGTASFEHNRITHSVPLGANALKGKTSLVHPTGEIEKVFTFLPSKPLINTPNGQRNLGKNAMRVILVHELIHACGLENSDHNKEDFFYENPVPFPGDSPAGDRIMLVGQGGKNIVFPKLFLAPATVNAVKALW